MATERSEKSTCYSVVERLRQAPDLQWAGTTYTASGMRATVVDANDGTEYELELRPKPDQFPRQPHPSIVVGSVTAFDRTQFLLSECSGCGHTAHAAYGCSQRATFTRRPCECDVHMGVQP